MIKKVQRSVFGILAVYGVGLGSALAINTAVLEKQGVLKAHGDAIYEGFTVSAATTVVFRYTSDRSSQAALVPESQLKTFTDNQGAVGLGAFDKTFGTNYVTLDPGKYYVAIRNASGRRNKYHYELDYDLTQSQVPGYKYSSTLLQKSLYMGGKARHYEQFDVANGARYFLDGCNTGTISAYVIKSDQLAKFVRGRAFDYYFEYSGKSGGNPGFWELNNLPAGSYYLAFKNHKSAKRPLTYTLERWDKQ